MWVFFGKGRSRFVNKDIWKKILVKKFNYSEQYVSAKCVDLF